MLRKKSQCILQHVFYLFPSSQIPELFTVKSVFFCEPVHTCLLPLSDIPEDMTCKRRRPTSLDCQKSLQLSYNEAKG